MGVYGLCWGGKIAAMAGATDVFNAVAQVHPARLVVEDFEALKVPIATYISQDEPKEIVSARWFIERMPLTWKFRLNKESLSLMLSHSVVKMTSRSSLRCITVRSPPFYPAFLLSHDGLMDRIRWLPW